MFCKTCLFLNKKKYKKNILIRISFRDVNFDENCILINEEKEKNEIKLSKTQNLDNQI